MTRDRGRNDSTRTIWDSIRRFFASRRGAMVYLLVLVGAVTLLTRTPLTLPFVVGWSDARELVQKQRKLARLKMIAREYRRTADFFETEEGRRLARKLVYNEYDHEEHLVVPRVQPASKPATVGQRAEQWINRQEKVIADWLREQVLILKCWVLGAPSEDISVASHARSLDELALEATSEVASASDDSD